MFFGTSRRLHKFLAEKLIEIIYKQSQHILCVGSIFFEIRVIEIIQINICLQIGLLYDKAILLLEENNLTKQMLEQYVDTCELIREIKEELQRLYQKNTYQENSLTNKQFYPEETFLREQMEKAEEIVRQVQQFFLVIPPRMRQIICMRYLDGKTWIEIGERVGRTADSVRIEVKRFFKESEAS